MTGTASTLVAVGVGPGDPAFLTLAATEQIAAADVVAGFKTALEVVASFIEGERLVLDYRNQEAGLARLAEKLGAGCKGVLCLYGDLNVSAGELLARAEAACGEVRRVPGISSIQIAMARSGLTLERSLFISFHKRADIEEDKRELLDAAMEGHRDLIVLPRPFDFMPSAIGRFLLEAGASGCRPVCVYERLTLEEERIHSCNLAAIAECQMNFSDLSIMMILRGR